MKQQEPIIRVAVALGSNLGNKKEFLIAARQELLHLGEHFRFSQLYMTEAVDSPIDLPFLNAAVSFDTKLSALHLLQELHRIEKLHGRVRSKRNAPRTLDLDLLLYGSEHFSIPSLEVPHPRLQQRLFVLVPLSEVWDMNFCPPKLSKPLAYYLELNKNRQSESLPVPCLDVYWDMMPPVEDN